MPFAVRFEDGTYLKRSPNPRVVGKRRSRTDNIDEATTWAQKGHAKNAILAGIESKDIRPSEFMEIVEVTYRIKAIEGRYSTRKTKTGRELVKLVSSR